MVSLYTTKLALKISTFCQESVFLCFVPGRVKVAYNIFGPSVWKLLHVIHLAPRILRCLLNFWKTFEPLQRTVIASLYSIKTMGFITETEGVYCAVRAKSLNVAQVNFRIQNGTFFTSPVL